MLKGGKGRVKGGKGEREKRIETRQPAEKSYVIILILIYHVHDGHNI